MCVDLIFNSQFIIMYSVVMGDDNEQGLTLETHSPEVDTKEVFVLRLTVFVVSQGKKIYTHFFATIPSSTSLFVGSASPSLPGPSLSCAARFPDGVGQYRDTQRSHYRGTKVTDSDSTSGGSVRVKIQG